VDFTADQDKRILKICKISRLYGEIHKLIASKQEYLKSRLDYFDKVVGRDLIRRYG